MIEIYKTTDDKKIKTPRDACKEGAPEWAIASAGVAAMKVGYQLSFIHFLIIINLDSTF